MTNQTTHNNAAQNAALETLCQLNLRDHIQAETTFRKFLASNAGESGDDTRMRMTAYLFLASQQLEVGDFEKGDANFSAAQNWSKFAY
jgi:hypothetical protein